MKITISPSELQGNILAPASKSSMQRACAAALVATKKSVIYNPGHSNDDKAAMGIIEALGATIEKGNEEIVIDSSGFRADKEASSLTAASEATINCGESGLSIRMFTPLAALTGNTITINGEGSLVTRPMDFFDEILPQVGVNIQSNQGKLPLVIQGPLRPKNITVDGSLSSQFLTGLLLAYAAASPSFKGGNLEAPGNNRVAIKVNNLKSKPYIDLTLDVMKKFGLRVPENKNYEEFIFTYGSSETSPLGGGLEGAYTVEGDWSGGAFLLVAGAIAGNITVRGLSMASTQADKKITEALMSANAGMAIDAKGIRLHKTAMNAFEFDATDCPDLFPPLVALAAYCDGITKIKGVSRLAHKESDRGITLQQEFGKMSLQVELQGDMMYVHGGKGLKGAPVHSRHDHRIAMACAVAALRAAGDTVIEEANAVNKSYPDFYDHIQSLGAVVRSGLDWKSVAKQVND
ncbi:3-phosphoshikimate 1-carboxyvinyltransferase [Niabella aquatica]